VGAGDNPAFLHEEQPAREVFLATAQQGPVDLDILDAMTRVACSVAPNVGVQGDLWQAQPDTGSALERIVRAVVPGTKPLFQRCPRL
jgi:hypothetical protein